MDRAREAFFLARIQLDAAGKYEIPRQNMVIHLSRVVPNLRYLDSSATLSIQVHTTLQIFIMPKIQLFTVFTVPMHFLHSVTAPCASELQFTVTLLHFPCTSTVYICSELHISIE